MFCCDAGLLKSFLCKNIQVFIKADKNKPTLILSSLKLLILKPFHHLASLEGSVVISLWRARASLHYYSKSLDLGNDL